MNEIFFPRQLMTYSLKVFFRKLHCIEKAALGTNLTSLFYSNSNVGFLVGFFLSTAKFRGIDNDIRKECVECNLPRPSDLNMDACVL